MNCCRLYSSCCTITDELLSCNINSHMHSYLETAECMLNSKHTGNIWGLIRTCDGWYTEGLGECLLNVYTGCLNQKRKTLKTCLSTLISFFLPHFDVKICQSEITEVRWWKTGLIVDPWLTLLRMKYLIMKKSRPDMRPDSRGEMNHEETASNKQQLLNQ